MFNTERLLGQLLGEAMGGGLGGRRNKRSKPGWGGGLSTGTKVQVGLGLLGVAMAAYEHYSAKPGGVPPPNHAGAMPPPPPTSPPPPPPANSTQQPEHALHLLRAMITAADADGQIDAQERATLLERAREAGLSAEELAQLDIEMQAPLTLQQLVVRTPESLRDEVYAAALIAITADTDAERSFLDQLAQRLGLDAGSRQSIHQQLGFN